MPSKKKTVAVVLGILGALAIILSVFMIGFTLRPQLSDLVIRQIMTVVFTPVAMFGVTGIFIGIGLLQERPQARRSMFVLSVIVAVAAIPVGVLINTAFEKGAPAKIAKKRVTWPMYGGIAPSPEQQAADTKFIESAIAKHGDRVSAATAVAMEGWSAMDKGEPDASMARFNEAWLLNPGGFEPYWGFGVLLGMQGDLDGSIEMLSKSVAIQNDNARVIGDLAFSHGLRGNKKASAGGDASDDYEKAADLFRKAHGLDSTYEKAYSNSAVINFYQGKYAEAWNDVNRARELGGNTLDPSFLEALKTKAPDPR